jgi:hypothetical protein
MIRALFHRGPSLREQLAAAMEGERRAVERAIDLNDRLTRIERANSARVRKGNQTRKAAKLAKMAELQAEQARVGQQQVDF